MRQARTTLALFALVAVPLAASCGGDETLGVTNVSPSGSVGGIVLDAATMLPVAGARVTVVAGGQILPESGQAVTDAKGYFAVNKVPAGSLIVRVAPQKAGTHAAVDIPAVLPNAAGEFPLANSTLSLGPIGLVPLTTKQNGFRVQLVTPDGGGVPANNPVFLRAPLAYVDFSSGDPKARGNLVVEAKTTASGLVTFAGMPDYAKLAGLVGSGGISDAVRVQVPPIDLDKDNTYDFLGTEVTYNVNRKRTRTPIIVLASGKAPNKLTILASNIAALMGKQGNRVVGPTGGSILVTFNLPIKKNQTVVKVYDERGNELALSPKLDVQGNQLTIPLQGLNQGAEYNLDLKTVAQVEGETLTGTFGAPFFTSPKPVAQFNVILGRDKTNASLIHVTFSDPVGSGLPGQSLAGSNAVVYFDYDINGSGNKGDSPAERGFATSNVTLTINEQNPPGKAGLSGLSKFWSFTLPNDSLGNPIPAGQNMDLLFSRSGLYVQKADGTPVSDVKNLTVPN